ncbi:hypothetical protein MMC09_001583 [Bachmanniomyces sp. S44760]|nr:hypothetical protein [Bachmanniomyces sp. S44760]
MNQQQQQQGYDSTAPDGTHGFGGPQVLANGVKRILKHHVLYLLITNMPTNEELRQAEAIIAQSEKYASQ